MSNFSLEEINGAERILVDFSVPEGKELVDFLQKFMTNLRETFRMECNSIIDLESGDKRLVLSGVEPLRKISGNDLATILDNFRTSIVSILNGHVWADSPDSEALSVVKVKAD